MQGSPNPITGAGAINIAPAYQLPQACSNGQVPKSNGAGGWACGTDSAGTGTVTSVATGAGLTGGPVTTTGTIAVNTATIQARVTGSCPVGSYIRIIAADGSVTCQTDSGGGGANAFVNGGNYFPIQAVLGTLDTVPLQVFVNGAEVMRFEPGAGTPYPDSPRIVAGGSQNRAIDAGATVSGGGRPDNPSDPLLTPPCADILSPTPTRSCANSADGLYATVGGGLANSAEAGGTVSGGESNAAAGTRATVAGGYRNLAGQYSAVGGGMNNVASGSYATVPGGRESRADADYSFASGYGAHASHQGSHVFADSSGPATVTTTMPNEFVVAAAGGIWLMNNKQRSVGCSIVGGNFNCTGTIGTPSDRALKTGIAAVAPQDILDRVAALPIASWEYKTAPGVRHVGPMAQDFHAAFGLGDSDRTIGVVDASGVALAAIQGLNVKVDEQRAALLARDARLDAQARRIAELEGRLVAAEALQLEVEALRATRDDVATLRAAVAELLRERAGGVTRARLAPAAP